MAGELSPALQQFLWEQIEGYGQLEVLLLLQRDPTKAWTTESASAVLKLPSTEVEEALASLLKRGMIERMAGDPPQSRYAAVEPHLRIMIPELAQAWQDNRLEVLATMNAQAMMRMRNSALRTFSEAFRLRGQQNDEAVYVLCAVTSALCATLLIRSYRRTRVRLLLWSGVCFVGLALNNLLLCIDLLVMPSVDLSLWRAGVALCGMMALLAGLVLESA